VFFIEKYHSILWPFFPSSNLTFNSIFKTPPPGDIPSSNTTRDGPNLGTFSQLHQYGATARTFSSAIFQKYHCEASGPDYTNINIVMGNINIKTNNIISATPETTNITYGEQFDHLETKPKILPNPCETKNTTTTTHENKNTTVTKLIKLIEISVQRGCVLLHGFYPPLRCGRRGICKVM